MPDVRNFRKYLEELSGNNLLKRKVAALERKNGKLEKKLAELGEQIREIRKFKTAPIPKKKGRKPRPMIRVIEDEMAKRKDRMMKVSDLAKLMKKKKVKSKAGNLYSSIAASLANNPKFEKVSPGEFRLKAESATNSSGKKKAKNAAKGEKKKA